MELCLLRCSLVAKRAKLFSIPVMLREYTEITRRDRPYGHVQHLTARGMCNTHGIVA